MTCKNRRYEYVILVACLVLTSTAGKLLAQTTGTVSGIVTDQTGAVIPRVSLKLQNSDTGEVRTSLSSAGGEYIFALIEPGTYELTASKSGFNSVSVRGLAVQVNTPLLHNITLTLGEVMQQVTVQASPVAVNYQNATLGEVIGPQKMVELPLNGRDFLQLATLSAGVNPPAVQNGQSVTQGLSGGRPTLTVSISGSREISPEFLFDGMLSKHDFYGAVGIEPPVDSIAEFKVQRGYFSPEFGAPGVVNVVIKSGTNSFHGAAWEFLRNDVLDARNFFDTTKPPYRQNQFGGNAGGRIVKDKVFFFGDYEGIRIRRSSTGYARVPTTQQLQGNFTGLPTIYDPATFNSVTQTRQPFTNNQIPTDRFSPFVAKYAQFIPPPNTAPIASLGGANLVNQLSHIQNDNKYDIKVDYNRSSKDTFFGRFSFLNSSLIDTAVVPFDDAISPLHSRNVALSWTHVFSPNIVNDFRAGLDRVFLDTGAPRDPTKYPDWPTKLGLTNLNQIPDCNAVPTVGLQGYTGFGYVFQNCVITGNTDKRFLDNLSYIRGRHHLSMGGQLVRVNRRNIGGYATNGSLQYTGQYTGNPATGAPGDATADYLLGAANNASGSAASHPIYFNAWWPDLYINDDFRVTPKLTLNAGLRWQFTQPLIEKYNNQGKLDFSTGQILYAGENGQPRNIISPRYADFSPRFGVAYSPRENWAIRASAGVFYDRLPGNETTWGTIFPKFACSYAISSDVFVPTIDVTTLFPTCTPQTTGEFLFDLVDRTNPYLYQWTTSIQRTLPSSMILEVAYIGSKGTHLSKRVDANLASLPSGPSDTRSVQDRRPFPQYSFILSDHGRGNSEYEGLQINLRKEFSQGLSFLTGYTWAKSLDNDSYDGKATRNYRPQDMDKGRSIFDLRNRFTASAIYQLPFGRSLTGLKRAAIAGWSINGILTFQSGLPFEVTTAEDFSNTGAFWIPRPNRICDGNLPGGQRSPNRWFDTSCFVDPLPNTYGNGGVAYLDTDGTKNLDFALLKDFKVSESKALQFRAEFFNTFNNVNFGVPGATLDTPSIGVVSSALSGRIIQFGLKFEW
jgi:hypothetical protein